MVGDITFYNSDRDIARVETGYNEDIDARPWQDEDEDRGS
jgi:hypothetical protein